MVRSVLYLRPRNGDVAALVDFYRQNTILERAVAREGCRSCELQIPLGNQEAAIVVTALWDDEAAYAGWLADDFRRGTAGRLSELVEDGSGESPRGDLYRVALAVGDGSGPRP